MSVGQHTAASSAPSLTVNVLLSSAKSDYGHLFVPSHFLHTNPPSWPCLSRTQAAVLNHTRVGATLFSHFFCPLQKKLLCSRGLCFSSPAPHLQVDVLDLNRVHWAWEIISDLLENCRPTISVVMWTCDARSVVPTRTWLIIDDSWVLLGLHHMRKYTWF